jgi:hypothetical protein
MTPRDLAKFLASKPASGGENERLRQERILSSTKELAQSLEQQRLAELKTLSVKASLTPDEKRRLGYLKRLYPEEATHSSQG